MKSKIFITIVVFSCLLIYSCSQKGEKEDTSASYSYSLQKTNKKLSYTLDRSTGIRIPALFPFTDKEGRKYLTFQGLFSYSIQIYEMYSGNHYKTIKIDEEGPNGVPKLLGYYIQDFDNIYLTAPDLPTITKVDTTGQVLQKISYEKTDNGMMLVPSYESTSTSYTPLAIIQDTFYITQIPMPRKEPDTWPVSCLIDTTYKSVRTLPLCFPSIMKGKNRYTTGIGPELGYSRCFDGSHFVYSFYFEEDITVASKDHKEIQKISAKSKYIDKINDPHEKRQADMFLGAKRVCEAAIYGDLIYDKYRNVYYRIAYPETEMEEEEGKIYIDIWTTGRKRFSLIILDKDFNIIGETLFPDYTYYSKSIFVEEEGLYIRSNHFKSPDFDENKLMFDCFELVEKK